MQIDSLSSQKRSGTVLFADVVGFTSLAEQVGEETAFEMIRDLSSRMQEAIRIHQGTVGEFRGDGIMALFSVTEGLEDGPLRACQAALFIQHEISQTRSQMIRLYGTSPEVRVGMHCGPLVVGDVGGETHTHVTIIGDTANVASRLESMADPGQILISRDLFALVEGQVETRDLGSQQIKGKSRPIQVLELNAIIEGVTRFEASRSRGLSELVDREEELAALETVFERARTGQIAVADIVGEPGIGKSRLLYEFQRNVDLDEVWVLEGNCRADGTNVPFLPFADMLRKRLGLEVQATAEQTEAAIVELFDRMSLETKTVLPYMMTLLGKAGDLSPVRSESADMVGARIRQAIVDAITYTSRQRLVLLVLEDLHWADEGTIQIIERLVTLADEMPVMILSTYRPSYTPPWIENPRLARIAPKPISEHAVAVLLRNIMGDSDDARKLAALAIEKSEGNPLYAEEIAKFLMQQQEAGGSVPSDIVLPTNLQNMVMERFDKLDHDCKALLQAASAIGRRFDGALAHRINGGTPPYSPELLAGAVKAELIRPEGSGHKFKHALVQDAIYDTLLRSRRREMHARIALELEHRYGNRTEEAAEPLAYHFDQADMPDKAAPHLISAGLRSLALFSLDAAQSSFARAFELIEERKLLLSPDKIAGLFAGWFEVLQWRAEFGKILKLFQSQQARLAEITADPQYPRVLALAGSAYTQNLRFDEAERLLKQAIEIGERTGDNDAIAYGCVGLMGINCTRPRPFFFERVQQLAERVHTVLGDTPAPYFHTYCDFYVNWSHSIRGDIDLARANGHDLLARGKKLNFSGAVGFGAICIAFNEAYCENYDAAIDYASTGAEEAGGRVDQMVSLGLKGLSMVLRGDVDGGAKILNDIYEQREALEYRGIDNIVDGPIGLAKALGGDLTGGVAWIKSAIDRALKNGNAHGAAMSHISLGTIYLLLATGTEKPDLSMLIRNAGFLLREAPFAKSRAITHFDAAIELADTVQMHGVMAQAQHAKAQALKAKRKTDKARAALQDARDAVQQIRWRMMEERIEADFAALD